MNELLKSSELDIDDNADNISICANDKNSIEEIEELQEHNKQEIRILKITHSNLSNLKVGNSFSLPFYLLLIV